jgi:hypothetical protein
MLRSADQIVPRDRRIVVEPEAPVRPPTFGFEPGPLGVAELQRGAIVDRRLAAAELDLALEVELLRGLVGRIDPAGGAQPLQRRIVTIEARALPMLLVGNQPEPGEIVADRRRIAVRMLPTWRRPVGAGAKRVTMGMAAL